MNVNFTKYSSAYFFGQLLSRYCVYWLKSLGFVSSVHSELSHVPCMLFEVPLPELMCVQE